MFKENVNTDILISSICVFLLDFCFIVIELIEFSLIQKQKNDQMRPIRIFSAKINPVFFNIIA
jgi:predicted Kef-type K+ transport protein